METVEKIIKTRNEIKEGHVIENNIIRSVEVRTIAHFGNLTTLSISCDNCCLYNDRNNTSNIGYLIKAFVELFDLSEEDGIKLSEIKDVPCRVVFSTTTESYGRVIGFGHYIKDKFVMVEDFARLGLV